MRCSDDARSSHERKPAHVHDWGVGRHVRLGYGAGRVILGAEPAHDADSGIYDAHVLRHDDVHTTHDGERVDDRGFRGESSLALIEDRAAHDR